jgi:hypothetical protein
MPKYTVTTPFGRKFSVTGPDNFTQADAIAYVQKQLGDYQPPPGEEDIYDISGIPRGQTPEEFVAGIPVDRGPFEALSAGVGRSFSRMGSTITDIIPALMGSAVGADDYARQQMEEAAAKEAALQETNPAQFPSFRDVKGIGDVLPFLGETFGEQAANIAATIGTGGVVRLLVEPLPKARRRNNSTILLQLR